MRSEYDFSKGKRGALIPQKGKTRISIHIDNATLDAFRARAEAAGTGYQTMMNEALRQYLADDDRPLTERRLREILEETFARSKQRPSSRSGDRAKIGARGSNKSLAE